MTKEVERSMEERKDDNSQRRWVAATAAIVLLAASVFLSAFAVLGVYGVRDFEFDPAETRDPYLYAAVSTMAAASSILFGGALAWHAATLRPVWKWRLMVVATIVTASILYLAAHAPPEITDRRD